MKDSFNRHGLGVPVLTWAVASLVSIFLHPALPMYSTRTLAVAWEMWDRGSWIVPVFNNTPYIHKTPFLQWLIHAGWALTGVNDIWPRLLIVLLGTCVVYQTGLLARNLYPRNPRAPAHAAWALAGLWYFFMFALQVMYELLLTCAVLGGLLALTRRDGDTLRPNWPAFALWTGLALLAKGPVALIHMGVPLLLARWWHPQARRDGWKFAGRAGAAALGGIALLSLWLVPALLLGGSEYREGLLVKQTVGRMHDSFAHAEPFWWYPPMLLVVLAPWWWSRWWWGRVPALWRDADNRFAFLWLAGVVAVFSAISGKLPYYLLPVFPAVALLLASCAEKRPRLGVVGGIVLLVLGVALACVRLWAARISQPYPQELLATVPVAGVVIALLGLALLRWRTLPAQAGGLLACTAVLHWAITPMLSAQFDLSPTARVLGQAQRNGAQIAYIGKYQLQFHFAGRLHDPVLVFDEAGARAWAATHPADLIAVNALDAWTQPGPQPVAQQRFRARWVQAWRAGDWLSLPAQRIPLGPAQPIDADSTDE